jgi:hypothetical protein
MEECPKEKAHQFRKLAHIYHDDTKDRYAPAGPLLQLLKKCTGEAER